jgi:hypothetical protein
VVVDGVEDDGVQNGEFWIAGGLGGGRRRQEGKKADSKKRGEVTRVPATGWGS